MGTYKTNWKLTETVMPEDFNRIEENIKENNKKHDDFKTEYDKTLKEQNKKIDSKSEKSDVVLKTPKRLLVTTDLNTVVEGGNYIVEQNTPNSPVGYGRLVVYQWDSPSKWITQVFYSDVTNEVYTRCSTNTEATSWTPWKKLISTSEADNKYLSKNLGIVSDFNNCKTPGIYTITGVDIPNAPFGGSMYGTLEVIPRGNDLIQRVSTSSGAMFFRYYASDGYNMGFRGWNKVYTDSTAPKWTEIREKPNLFTQSQSDDRYFRTYIEEVSDFNTCLHEGKYIVSSSKALLNSPISSDVYGELLVLTRGDSGELHQIYFDYRTKIFTRFKSNGSGWSAWAQTYSTTNKPNWNDVVNKPDLDSKYFLNYRDSVTDFNNCKSPGNYYVSKANILNAPYASTNPLYGTLMVSKTFDDCTQVFVDRFANICTRYYNNASKVWTNWVSVYTSINPPRWKDITEKPEVLSTEQSDDRYPISDLGTVTDFNNCKTHPGTWLVNSGAPIPNAPYVGGVWGTLEVLNSTVKGDFIQRFTNVGGDVFSRYYHASTKAWDSWVNYNKKFVRSNVRDVVDFNTCLDAGIYFVGSYTSLPNAPFTDPNGIYGTLEVLPRKTEYIQRFTNSNSQVFIRFRNYKEEWTSWVCQPNINDFEGKNGQSHGYQKLPSGIIIQWGSTVIPFDGYRAHGYLYYPVAFKEYVHCCGNVASNDYGGFCETSGTVVGDTLARGYAEALDVGNGNRHGHNVRFQWIAIGK